MNIPERNRDLCRYVRRQDIRRAILFLLWVAAWVSGAIAYNLNHQTYPPERKLIGWKFALLVCCAVAVGFFLFRVWKCFTDRTFCAVVEDAGLSHTYSAPSDPVKTKLLNYDFRTNTRLILRRADGKQRRLSFEEKENFYWYYANGKALVKFHGLPYPVCTDPAAPDGYLCAACGRIHKKMPAFCEHCGMTVIDPKEIEK